MTKGEGNAADACLPVGRGVFHQPAREFMIEKSGEEAGGCKSGPK